MTHPALAAMLKAAAALEGVEGIKSPLAEVDPASLDELWLRINDCLIGGMPELITNEELQIADLVMRERAARMEWDEKSAKRVNRPPGKRKGPATPQSSTGVELDLDEV